MASLADLRQKWFLSFGVSGTVLPPVARHPGSLVAQYTDGNLVTPLIEGSTYMQEWHDEVLATIGQTGAEIYHAAWRFDGVRTLGNLISTSNALDVLNEADNADVEIFPMICNNVTSYTINNASAAWMLLHGIVHTVLDDRFPVYGSNHQKFTVFKRPGFSAAIVAGLDITKSRWDRASHSASDEQRDADFADKPTHELGLRIVGPAVADIERTFRERWSDPIADGFDFASITTPVVTPAPIGTHSVQVLRTYARITEGGYTWSAAGEFTVWASYLNAIKKAASYLYIEDQYFFSFDWPPCFARTGAARDTDLVYQLGEAIKRGVKVVVLVPSTAEDWSKENLDYQRAMSVKYLVDVAAAAGGEFVVATLHNGLTPIFVHSKVMICDDEFVLAGSANFNQRSMTHDSELHLGIVDGANVFARDLRTRLWSEHLQRPAATLTPLEAAYAMFKNDVAAGLGRVRPYQSFTPGLVTKLLHSDVMRYMADPYGGPEPR